MFFPRRNGYECVRMPRLVNPRRIAACLLLCVVLAEPGEAGQVVVSSAVETPGGLPFAFAGPAAPVPPEVVSRDAAGHVTPR